MEELQEIALRLQTGDFAATDSLVALLKADERSVRERAAGLLALCCNHSQVVHLRDALYDAEDLDESKKVAMYLGDTLSLSAVPILVEAAEEIEDEDLNAYIALGLDTLAPHQDLDELSIGDSEFRQEYLEWVESLDQGQYFYRGSPFFVGNLTKELVAAAQVSAIENKPAILIRQAQLLSAVVGSSCPIGYGALVTKPLLKDVYDWVKGIAAGSWQVGKKYYFGRQIPSSE